MPRDLWLAEGSKHPGIHRLCTNPRLGYTHSLYPVHADVPRIAISTDYPYRDAISYF